MLEGWRLVAINNIQRNGKQGNCKNNPSNIRNSFRISQTPSTRPHTSSKCLRSVTQTVNMNIVEESLNPLAKDDEAFRLNLKKADKRWCLHNGGISHISRDKEIFSLYIIATDGKTDQ